MSFPHVGLRWTIGDVHPLGFDALRLSLWGARKVFGRESRKCVCVNTIPLARAKALTGEVPEEVQWIASPAVLPDFMRSYVHQNMAEGVAWKFSPLRTYADAWEISLDNDCILFELPRAIRLWLEEQHPERCVIAEDTRTALGQFQAMCGPEPRNSGIRGLPPGFDFAGALQACLRDANVILQSELDEQGLQVAAVNRRQPALVVRTSEVAICSPFPDHIGEPGSCGAHFVGLNAKRLPWTFEGREASELTREHYRRWREELARRIGIRAGAAPD